MKMEFLEHALAGSDSQQLLAGSEIPADTTVLTSDTETGQTASTPPRKMSAGIDTGMSARSVAFIARRLIWLIGALFLTVAYLLTAAPAMAQEVSPCGRAWNNSIGGEQSLVAETSGSDARVRVNITIPQVVSPARKIEVVICEPDGLLSNNYRSSHLGHFSITPNTRTPTRLITGLHADTVYWVASCVTVVPSGTRCYEYQKIRTLIPDTSNQGPTANAGADQTVGSGTTATLDGSGSSDPENDSLHYRWVQVSGPNVQLSDPTAESPTFTAPSVQPGQTLELEFQLRVHDGNRAGTSDNVVITTYRSVTFIDPVFDIKIPDPPDNSVYGVGESVSLEMPIIWNGIGPFTHQMTVDSGALPAGLSIAGDQQSISGTTTATGTATMTYTVTDTGSANMDSIAETFKITVVNRPIVSVELTNAAGVVQDSFQEDQKVYAKVSTRQPVTSSLTVSLSPRRVPAGFSFRWQLKFPELTIPTGSSSKVLQIARIRDNDTATPRQRWRVSLDKDNAYTVDPAKRTASAWFEDNGDDGRPAAPVLRAYKGYGGIELVWESGGDGGSAITGWEYQKRKITDCPDFELPPEVVPSCPTPWSSVSWESVSGATANTRSVLLTAADGIESGAGYSFRVRAFNNSGDGSASNVASVTLDEGIPPGAPVDLVATGLNGEVELSWKNVTAPGTDPVTHWQYRWRKDGNPYTKIAYQRDDSVFAVGWYNIPGGASKRILRVFGVEDGVTYHFQVRAVSAAGAGVASPEVSARPVSDTARITGLSFVSTPKIDPTPANPISENNTYGVNETIIIEARFNQRVTVTGAPTMPLVVGTTTRNMTYTSGSGSSRLWFSYTVVASDRDSDGVDVTASNLIVKPTGAEIKKSGTASNANLGSTSGNGLAGQEYHNVDGSKDASGIAAPAAPTLDAATLNTDESRRVDLAWTAGSNGGSQELGYQVRFRVSGEGWRAWRVALRIITDEHGNPLPQRLEPLGPNATGASVRDLPPGKTYGFQVRAVNSAGEGAPSNEVTVAVPSAPMKPASLTATAGNEEVALAWVSGGDGASAITRWEYRQSDSGRVNASK